MGAGLEETIFRSGCLMYNVWGGGGLFLLPSLMFPTPTHWKDWGRLDYAGRSCRFWGLTTSKMSFHYYFNHFVCKLAQLTLPSACARDCSEHQAHNSLAIAFSLQYQGRRKYWSAHGQNNWTSSAGPVARHQHLTLLSWYWLVLWTSSGTIQWS